MSTPENSFVLTIVCPDTVGIVAAVSTYLSDRGHFIEASNHYGDPDTRRFFMRTCFTPTSAAFSHTQFTEGFTSIAEKFSMDWHLFDQQVLPRILIIASKHEHCVNDLLYRYRTGALRMTIPAIVSNHLDLAPLAEWHRIPYFHVPISPDTKPEAERQLLKVIDDTKADLIVVCTHGRKGLARFGIGSVTERVVRAAECPVLTVHSTTS